MATATSTFASYDSMNFPISDNSIRTRENYGFFTSNSPHSAQHRMVHCLDDMDVLALKRQYANLDLFEQSALSNSAEDLSQLDRIPYPFQIFGQEPLDLDDDDIPYDDGSAYEYTLAIQERLKRANEEFKQDQTPVESKHSQRVSFDTVVKAVDIIVDSDEQDQSNSLLRPSMTSFQEEPTEIPHSPQSDANTAHQYTVPLNDIQPRQGLSLLEKMKELQFHSSDPAEERWATNPNNDSVASNREEDISVTSFKSNENNVDSQDLSTNTSLSTASKKTMIVSVNGRFDLQNEDDYVAQETSQSTNKPIFLPAPPAEPKAKANAGHRPSSVRPKSSSIEKKSKAETTGPQRPKSANPAKSLESFIEKPPSGVDFPELLRKAAEKKRADRREERRKKEEAEDQRQKELAKAKESYERWLQEKDAERKRIREEKRLEQQEHETRQAEEEKALNELREKKFQQWLQRKDQEVLLANEFEKLKADEEAKSFGGDSNHRAFQKWLRQKYLKSLEDKRQERLDTKRQRRRHRKSIKRDQLQKDIQLARTFGYS